MIYKKINTTLQYTIHSAVRNLYYNLTSYFQLLTLTIWLISVSYIDQLAYGIVLDGIIWTSAQYS